MKKKTKAYVVEYNKKNVHGYYVKQRNQRMEI
jgi:hypothetical protein